MTVESCVVLLGFLVGSWISTVSGATDRIRG